MPSQVEPDVQGPPTAHVQIEADSGSSGGLGGRVGGGVVGTGDKELAGEPQNVSAVTMTAALPLNAMMGADGGDSDPETSRDETEGSTRSSNICGIVFICSSLVFFASSSATNMLMI